MPMNMTTTREGGCACGQVRFRVDGPPLGVAACFCTDCQKASGGAANHVALIPKQNFHVMSGEPRSYCKKSEEGNEAIRLFCPDCGTPLWSEPANMPFYPVKVGAFDEHADLKPTVNIFLDSAAPWHLIHDGIPGFAAMPPAPPQ